jgi:chemotaxis-related protein WspD
MPEKNMKECWRVIGVWGDKSCPELARHIRCRNCSVFASGGRALFDREPPGDYLEQWAAFLAAGKEQVAPGQKPVCVFRLNSEWFALPSGLFVEIVGVRPVRPVPHRSNRVVLGIVSVRGEIHLCVSLAALMEVEREEARPESDAPAVLPRLCVIRRENVTWVFPADEVLGWLRYDPAVRQPVPVTVARSVRKFSEALLPIEGRKAGLLNGDLIFEALMRSVLWR